MRRPPVLLALVVLALPALPAFGLDPKVSEPALMKIEEVRLSTTCPEGWRVRGIEAADGSFVCDAIPDTYAPTNLIHCLNGLKYFARAGRIGCRNPAVPFEEPKAEPRKTKTATAASGGAQARPVAAKPKAGP